jgi:hypothetical protein
VAVAPGPASVALEILEGGAPNQALLVEHPLAALREPSVSHAEGGLSEHARARDDVGGRRVRLGEHQ